MTGRRSARSFSPITSGTRECRDDNPGGFLMDSRALEQDIDLVSNEAEDVKGGGIVSASATVGGATLSVDDTNVSLSGAGVTASNSGSSWGAGASAGGQSAGAGGKKPTVRKPRVKKSRHH